MDVVTANLANQNMAEQPTQDTTDSATATKATDKPSTSQDTEKNQGVLVPVTSSNVAQKCYDCKKLLAKLEKVRKELLDYHRKHDCKCSHSCPYNPLYNLLFCLSFNMNIN